MTGYWVAGTDNPADMLTKPVPSSTLGELKRKEECAIYWRIKGACWNEVIASMNCGAEGMGPAGKADELK